MHGVSRFRSTAASTCNAAHALCTAALRWHGYRAAQRYVVFQRVTHTVSLGPEVWRVLARSHELRNRAEYEGVSSIDERRVRDPVDACSRVLEKVDSLAPIK
jgi:hypothetical protein